MDQPAFYLSSSCRPGVVSRTKYSGPTAGFYFYTLWSRCPHTLLPASHFPFYIPCIWTNISHPSSTCLFYTVVITKSTHDSYVCFAPTPYHHHCSTQAPAVLHRALTSGRVTSNAVLLAGNVPSLYSFSLA